MDECEPLVAGSTLPPELAGMGQLADPAAAAAAVALAALPPGVHPGGSAAYETAAGVMSHVMVGRGASAA